MEQLVATLERQGQQPTPLADRATAHLPSRVTNVTLHAYQLDGLQWLLRKHEQGLSSMLGDEMGLGKTLQVIAFLAALMGSDVDVQGRGETGGRYLVIAPLSVLPTWMEQFEQYAPSVSTVMFIGSREDRDVTQKAVAASPVDNPLVVVTSYEMLLHEHEFLCTIVWGVMIMDEGHRLKNPKGQLHRIVGTRLRSKHRVILTGTPIQNNLDELYALLSILNPSIFQDQELFTCTFRDHFS